MGMHKRDHLAQMCAMPGVRSRWTGAHGARPRRAGGAGAQEARPRRRPPRPRLRRRAACGRRPHPTLARGRPGALTRRLPPRHLGGGGAPTRETPGGHDPRSARRTPPRLPLRRNRRPHRHTGTPDGHTVQGRGMLLHPSTSDGPPRRAAVGGPCADRGRRSGGTPAAWPRGLPSAYGFSSVSSSTRFTTSTSTLHPFTERSTNTDFSTVA